LWGFYYSDKALTNIYKAKCGSLGLGKKHLETESHTGRHQKNAPVSMNDRSSKQENLYWYILAKHNHHSIRFNSYWYFNYWESAHASQYHMEYSQKEAKICLSEYKKLVKAGH
jgi:hypothetical protein